MVTLALLSMTGMMGLAVDLGYAYFSQKAAQAAADDAALSAVQRAYKSITSGGGLATSFSTCGSSGVTCKPTPVACDPTDSTLGNLQSGCLYARNDGYTPGGHGGRQNVLIEANIPSAAYPDSIPATPGSPKDMVYWVTVRTYESIPQLFSAILNNNSNGAISAVATAAIASEITPGSFWGMNRIGDCRTTGGSAKSGFTFTSCGVDIDVSTHTAPCGVTGKNAFLCAPSGILLSSVCAGTSTAGCGNATSTPATTLGSNYAGNNGAVWGDVIDLAAAHSADGLTTTTPEQVAGVPVDPYANKPQPPLAASQTSNSAIGSCGYSGGSMPANSTFGPLQFYSYTLSGSVKVPDGQPLSVNGATFDPTKTGALGCPSPGIYTAGTNTQSANSSFPTYIFYGGMSTGNSTITLGSGQYVLAGNLPGQNTCNGCSGGSDNVLAAKQTTFVGSGTTNSASDAGTMLILTDNKYPGLSTQIAGIPNYSCTAALCGLQSKIDPNAIDPSTGENYLVQGSIQTKLVNWTLDGYDKNNTTQQITQLDEYSGVLLWQDRRNSTDIYDSNGNVVKCYVTCATAPTAADYEANNVTWQSPGLSMSDGNGTLVMKGAIVQPRGAWYNIFSGTAGVGNSPLQILTGMLLCTNGCGNDSVTLLGPSNPIISYLPVLIQ